MGMVESQLSENMLRMMVALRFGVITLASLALYWAICDISEHWRGRGTRAPGLYYFVKVIMALSILLYSPAGLLRAAVIKINPVLTAYLTMTAMVLTCAYFILMQTVKHLYAGETKRTAWLRTVPIVIATVLLMGLGAIVNDRL
jgi:hypothetical protein